MKRKICKNEEIHKAIKINIPILTLTVVFTINLYYLYLLDPYNDTIMGIPAQDFALVVAMIWGIYYWFKMIKKANPSYRYGRWMLSLLGMAILSSLQSNILYGQSLMWGFAPQRWVLIWALMYFPIRKLIYYNKINGVDLLRMMCFVGLVQLVLFSAQFFLEDSIEFLCVNTGSRNGSTRYYFGHILMDFVFLVYLDRFNRGKIDVKLKTVFGCGGILFELMVVQQFRLASMALILCLGLFVVFSKNRDEVKLVYYVLGTVVLGILFSTSLVQDVLNQVLNNAYDSGMQIRSVGKKLYFDTLLKHPVLGGGYPSSFYGPARQAAGIDRFIYLDDNGVAGFMYLYGSLGIVWVVTLWRRLLLDGKKIRDSYNELAFFLFPVFLIIVCNNSLCWYWQYGFVVFSLYLCLAESRISFGDCIGRFIPIASIPPEIPIIFKYIKHL